MRRYWLVFSQAVTVLLAAYFVVATLQPDWVGRAGSASRATGVNLLEAPAPTVGALPAGSFRQAAQRASAAVVSINTSKAAPRNPHANDPWFRFFFGDQDGQPQVGLGSGVIISPDGYILTNNHVVEGADEVLVELSDGRQFKASDIKTDEQSDLAVLRIKAAEPLPAAALGDSDTMEIGDWVLAVGNPFELELTVSAGIISSKGRTLAAGKRANFLQTDAAINPGNSGGPLVNLDGEVIGINTAIATNSGSYQGVGFAIPINLAKWVTQQLIKTGSVQRAYLGVGIGEINSTLAQKLGVEPHKGVLVSEVFPNSPAAAAGLREGDIIRTFAGQAVSTARGLQEVVERAPLGSKQQMAIIRDGKPTTLDVVVKALPGDFGVAGKSPKSGKPAGDPGAFEAEDLGLNVSELTDNLAQRLGFKGFSGVLISGVTPNGIAAEAGLREGMLILRVGKKPVASVAEFKAAIKGESLKEGVMLLVRTQEGNRFVVLQQS
jgi:serine protease Do